MNTIPMLGGDPEFFIYIKKRNGTYEIISADKAGLPGKDNPHIVNSGMNRVFFDGVQAEINFAPNQCREVITGDMRYCIGATLDLVRNKLKKDTTVHFAPLASIEVTPKTIENTDKECTRFGCSPDMNIYTEPESNYPDGHKFMTRYSGGHIHLGFCSCEYMKKMQEPDKLRNLIRMMDIFPGIMSVCLSQGEEEKVRRKYYGKAGSYRIQPHGLEYRPLSSFWLVSPQMVSLIYALSRDAFTYTYHDKDTELIDSVSKLEIMKVINDCNTKKATEIWDSILKPFYLKYPLDNTPMKSQHVIAFIDDMIKNGGYQSVFNPMNMLHYWAYRSPNPFVIRGWDRTFGIQGFLSGYDPVVMKTIREEK